MKTRLLEIKDRVKTAKAAIEQMAVEGNLNLDVGFGNHAMYELEESFARVGEILEELDEEDRLRDEWVNEMVEAEQEDYKLMIEDRWKFGL